MDKDGQDYERVRNWDHRSSLTRISLPGYDLTQVDLENAKLHEANFSGAILRAGKLVGANLTDADLTNCDLSHTNLENAILTRARLDGANLRDTNLSGAILTEATLRQATLWNADFHHAGLNKVDLTDTHITLCSMQMASLWKANLQRAYVKSVDFNHANLSEVDAGQCVINDVDFSGAYLWHTNFLDSTGNLPDAVNTARCKAGCVLPDGRKLPTEYEIELLTLRSGEMHRGERANRRIQMLAGEVWVTSPLGIDQTLAAGQSLEVKNGVNLLITALGDDNAAFILS